MDDVLDVGGLDTQEATEVNPADVGTAAETQVEAAVETEAPTSEPVYLDFDSYASHVAKVTVDGEEIEVPLAELRDGYQRQADYTRKTQALAEQAKEYADAVSVYEALRSDPQGFLADLSKALGDDFSAADTQKVDDVDDDLLDPTEREVRELKKQLEALQQIEQRRTYDSEVARLTEKYGPDVDIAKVVNHFATQGFPTLEAAYKDLAYDQELERLKELEAKTKRDAEALEKKRKASAVTAEGSKAAGAVGTDPTQVRGIRAQYELAKKQLGMG